MSRILSPGSMLAYDEYIIDKDWEHPVIAVLPGGYLIAVLVRKMSFAEDQVYKLTRDGEDTIYGEFPVYAPMTCGGMQLPDLPNMNVAQNYWIKLPENQCNIRIITVNRIPEYG